ncbi:MAG: putative zinc-binding protein [Methanomassiliicoccales archaeon]
MSQDKGACLCGGAVLIYPCSGGSNVGQIANEVAKRLATEGKARMACIAGIGGHVSGIVKSAENAEFTIVVDGCQLACGKKSFEHHGLVPTKHVVITDLGIKKSYDLNAFVEKDIEHVSKHVISLLPMPSRAISISRNTE